MKNYERRQVGILANALSNDFEDVEYLLDQEILQVPEKSIDLTRKLITIEKRKAPRLQSSPHIITELDINTARDDLADACKPDELDELDEIAKIFKVAVQEIEDAQRE
jgi:hypothetical protein